MVTTNRPARGLNWTGMRAPGARALIVVLLTGVLLRADSGARLIQAPSPFAAQIAAASGEPEGEPEPARAPERKPPLPARFTNKSSGWK